MTFDSPTAVQQLQTLERQLAEAQRQHDALRVAWTRRSGFPPLQVLCVRISIGPTVRIDVQPDAPLIACVSTREHRVMERAS